jgi:thiol-disulfide isomerase/thioredoxin
MIESAQTEEEFFKLIQLNDIVIVDCYATWCQPCMQILKILPRLHADLDARISLVKMDVDLLKSIKEFYQVVKVPTFLFFKQGREVARREGVTPLKEIKELGQSLLDVL